MQAGWLKRDGQSRHRPIRPLVIQGMDEKLAEHYENWKRLEAYLKSTFAWQDKSLADSTLKNLNAMLTLKTSLEEAAKNHERLMSRVSEIEKQQAVIRNNQDVTYELMGNHREQSKMEIFDAKQAVIDYSSLLCEQVIADNKAIRKTIRNLWYGLAVTGVAISTLVYIVR